MNWEAIGAIGEVGGAIAVVATLAYLARQIRHSTEATRIAAYHQAQEQLWAIGIAVSNDPELTRILARTFAGDLDSLELPDRMRLEFALGTFYFGMESMLALHEKGYIDSELWQNVFVNNFRLLGSPLGHEYLASRRGPISRRLEAQIDEYVNRKGAA
jgi:hypothetical protein